MRYKTLISATILTLTGFALPSEMIGQQAAQVQRDPNAVALLQRSLAAMRPAGNPGESAVIANVIVSGEVHEPYSTAASDGSFVFTDSFASGQHRYRRDTNILGKKTRLVSNEGVPQRKEEGKPAQILRPTLHRYYAADHVPYAVIAGVISDETIGIRIVKVSNAGSVRVTQIETTEKATVPTAMPLRRDWYFDTNTALPLASSVLFQTNDTTPVTLVQTTRYSDYQQWGPIISPATVIVSLGTRELLTLKVTQIRTNTSMDEAQFKSIGDVQ